MLNPAAFLPLLIYSWLDCIVPKELTLSCYALKWCPEAIIDSLIGRNPAELKPFTEFFKRI
jgi:hypothetical protein